MSSTSKPEALTRTLIYQSRWVNLYVDKVQFPNGSIIEKHHLLDFDHQSVMTVAQDQNGRYLMVKVCRYPTGRAEWEFSAGGIEEDEGILQASARELLEETGCHSFDHQLLYTYNPMNGIANQVFHIVRCQVSDPIGEFDANEISAVRWFTAEEIWQMVRTHEMQDGYALTSFLLSQHL